MNLRFWYWNLSHSGLLCKVCTSYLYLTPSNISTTHYPMNPICQAYMMAESHLLTHQISEAITSCRKGISFSEEASDFTKWVIGQRKLMVLLQAQMQQYDVNGMFEKSKAVLQEMEEIKLRLLDGQSIDWTTLLHYKGSAENELNHLKKGLHFLESSLFYNERQQVQDLIKQAHLEHDIAYNYYTRGDYETAIQKANQSIAICEQIGWENLPLDEKIDLSVNFNTIGLCLQQQGKYEEARKSFEKIIPNVLANTHHLFFVYNNIGCNYFFAENYEKSIEYNDKLLAHYQYLVETKIFSSTSFPPAIFVAYSNLGNSYLQLNKFKKAKAFHFQAVELAEKQQHALLPGAYLNYTKCLVVEKKFEEALELIYKAFTYLFPDYQSNQIWDNPIFQPQYIWRNASLVFKAFQVKIATLSAYYKEQRDPKILESCIECIECAELYIRAYHQSYKAEISKYNLIKELRKIYEQACDIHLFLWMQEKKSANLFQAFTYADKGKGLMLLSEFHKRLWKESVSSKIFQPLQNLKVELATLENQVLQASDKQLKHKYIAQFNETQENYNQQLQELIKEHPQYVYLSNQEPIASLENWQTCLKSHECLLTYFVQKKRIEVFYFTRKSETIQHFSIEQNELLKEVIEGFVERVFYALNQRMTYIEAARLLYTSLMEKVIMYIKSDPLIDSLIIVPDKNLAQIPFECLLMEEINESDSFQDFPYLIQQYNVQYHYSAQLLYDTRMGKSKSNQLPTHFTGIVPAYLNQSNFQETVQQLRSLENKVKEDDERMGVLYPTGAYAQQLDKVPGDYVLLSKETLYKILNQQEETYSPLPYSLVEAKKIASLVKEKMDTCLLLNEQATKQNFIKQSKDADYLLISAHTERVKNLFWGDYGIVLYHESEPLKYELLLANEVQNMEMQANLVVLNMCDSGLGQYVEGESLMNMGRAFFVAGASNVVYTLYKVYDQWANRVVYQFFESLQKGKSLSEALAIAKRSLIKEEGVYPMLWASHLLVGEGI